MPGPNYKQTIVDIDILHTSMGTGVNAHPLQNLFELGPTAALPVDAGGYFADMDRGTLEPWW